MTPPSSQVAPQTVLIVDDSLTAARQLEKIITASNEFVSVGCAANGAEAITMNHRENPDIICMDMNMPTMDGLSALRTLKTIDAQVKIVMVTSLAGVDDKYGEALRLGASGLISKPFETETILTTLRQI